MQLLTTQGYKNIEDCVIGEQLFAYDIGDGHIIINTLLDKQRFSPEMFEDQYSEPEQAVDENGNPIMTDPVLLKTKEEVFEETYGEFKFYLVNGTYTLFKNQSVWANMRVVHASDLQIGDVLYNDQNQDVIITSLEETVSTEWWRLNVSGDHSYIADNLSLHNASRYWVGGGSSQNWNATANTNWGSASGTQDNSSVPTSADDAIFDGGGGAGVGDSDSTISATITVLSLTITTGYTSTMTHNAELTIAGNWTFVNTYTIAGASGITISAASTITSNGTTWTNALTFSNANTKTLVGNLTVNGLLTISATTTLNRTTTETITLAGGMTINAGLSGTADISWTGGTWSQGATTYNIENNLTIAGNVTFSGANTSYGTGTLTYSSGTVTTTGNTLNIRASCTLNTNGITWNNLSFIATNTTILTSNLTINGVLNITASSTTTINRTTAETVTCAGGMSINAGLSGTATIEWTGGGWSGGSTTYGIANNVNINGNVTVASGSNTTIAGGTWTYISGVVTTTGSTLWIRASCTLNTSGITWNNINTQQTITTTLTSNLTIGGLLTISATTTINRTTAETVTCAGGMTISAGLSGTAEISWTGGTWTQSSTSYRIGNNLTIAGNVTLSGANTTYGTGTLTYSSGTVTTTSNVFNISETCTLNTNGIIFNDWLINVGGSARTCTLTSNLTINGNIGLSSAVTNGFIINRTTAETVTINGGITVQGAGYLQGTALINFNGGTWTSTSTGGILSNTTIGGNVTIATNARYSAGVLTYSSGTVTTTGSTLSIVGGATLNTTGISWNNITFVNTGTIILTSNLLVGGILTVSGTTTINRTTAETVTCAGGVRINSGITLQGTAKVIATGGELLSVSSATSRFFSDLDINGDVIITQFRFGNGKTFNYISGFVNVTNGTFIIQTGANFNSNGITFNNFIFDGGTTTLTSNLTCVGLLNSAGASTVNSTTSESITTYGGLSINTLSGIGGTAPINLLGGTWSTAAGRVVQNNLNINGNIILDGDVNYATGTLSYINGKINSQNGRLIIFGSATMLGFNKAPLRSIVVTAGQTLTCDQLPVGSEDQILQISSTGANYTIAFQDAFEKIGRNVALSGATLSRPMQLLVTTNVRFNTNRSTNGLGIRYYNQLPNGFAENTLATVDRTLTGVQGGLWADPCFQRQG